MEETVHTCQKWQAMSIKSHAGARGTFTITFLLSALFAVKSYGHHS